ncbi:MAG: hypothetical protein AAF600_16675 [Bacteroidota bacterium]
MDNSKIKEDIVRGNYAEILVAVALSFGAFSFFSPKVFVFLNYYWDCPPERAFVFQIFYCLYLLLPVLFFVALYFLLLDRTERHEKVLLVVKGQKFNTSTILLMISFIMLVLNLVGVVKANIDNQIRPAFVLHDSFLDFQKKVDSLKSTTKKINNHLTELENKILLKQLSGSTPSKTKDTISVSAALIEDKIDFIAQNVFDLQNYEQAIIIKSVYDNLLLQLLNKFELSNMAKTKQMFRDLFRTFQDFSLTSLILILSTSGFILFIYHRQNRINQKEGFLLKTMFGCYLLMTTQMIQPIKVEHINLQREGFQYQYHNWYLPDYLASQVNESNDFSNDNYNIYNQFDEEALLKMFDKLDEHMKNMNVNLENIDSALRDQGLKVELGQKIDSVTYTINELR